MFLELKIRDKIDENWKKLSQRKRNYNLYIKNQINVTISRFGAKSFFSKNVSEQETFLHTISKFSAEVFPLVKLVRLMVHGIAKVSDIVKMAYVLLSN